MECNILKELAVFDPNAPINVSISFEDSDESDEMPVKTENLTDDYNNQIVNYLPDTGLKLREKVKEEPTSIYKTIEEDKADTQNEQNIIQKDTFLRSGHSQNNILNNSDLRKRKITQLNIYKNKKRSNQTSTSEPNNQSSPVNNSENMCENSQAETSPISISNQSNSAPTANLLNSSKNANENQVQSDKLSSYIKRCLLPVSEHLRLIMEAYSYHRKQNTPKAKDAFNILKTRFFNLSYSTVVAMLLPEEKNVDFIKTFLKETHRHACETSSVYNKGTLKDYEILLREMLHWAKYNKMIIDKTASKKDTVLKPSSGNENKNVQELNKTLEQNPPNNITETDKNADRDKICIFSAGFQGNEISINVDPTLQKYLHNMNNIDTLENNQPLNPINVQEQSPNPSITRAETELIKYLTKSPLKFRNSKQDALNQSTGQPIILQSSNIPQIPQSNYPSQHSFEFNHPYVNVNASKSEPLTQMQQLLPQQSGQVPSQQTLQQYGLSSEVLQQQYNQITHSAPQYRPTHHSPQYEPTHHVPQYRATQHGPTHHAQSSQSQSQCWQSKLGHPQHKQLNRAQSTAIWQPPHRMPQHGQQQRQQSHNPPSYEQINRQRQYVQQQNLLRQYLPSQNVSPPSSSQYGTSIHIQAQHSPLQHGQSQYRQVQSGQPQNVLPQFSQMQAVNIQPEKSPTEWQQSNMLQYQTQAPTGVLAHSSSLRTVSTDSGFISPLNFVSSEQMVPPDPPQAPSEGDETANLLITHVTSLNPKVAFIQEDNCVVCKTLTKQVCMGCMQRYYCSYGCQLIDWTNHEASCKRVTT